MLTSSTTMPCKSRQFRNLEINTSSFLDLSSLVCKDIHALVDLIPSPHPPHFQGANNLFFFHLCLKMLRFSFSALTLMMTMLKLKMGTPYQSYKNIPVLTKPSIQRGHFSGGTDFQLNRQAPRTAVFRPFFMNEVLSLSQTHHTHIFMLLVSLHPGYLD